MRLIDADALIERIQRNDALPWNLDKIMQVSFESCVRHSPTAYDVDKVVEQILEFIAYDENAMGLKTPEAFDRLIEIVKKGGIE